RIRSIAQHSTAEATRSQRTYLMENNRSNQQAPPPPPGVPDGGCGAGPGRREEGAPGEHQIQGREGLHRGMPRRTVLLLDLRDVLRLTGRPARPLLAGTRPRCYSTHEEEERMRIQRENCS
uniref:Uncharacterized protein n=1 Tax=Aegilops tauschii subsp. strangulata TaxID=200361 RepID=A0A453GMB3_AEGTS